VKNKRGGGKSVEKISSQFYARVLHVVTATAPELRYETICKLILQQAIQQLDPLGLGMAITVIVCTEPPSERNVHSLRVSIGQGTLPGMEGWDQLAIFLGVESLAGYAATCGHRVTVQNLREDHHLYYPVNRLKGASSAIATPIRRLDGIAGCLSIYSTQPGYFSPCCQELVQSYADLLTLAFEPRAFYELERLELGIMPARCLQLPYFASFQQRLIDTLKKAAYLQLSISIQTAELRVWQQIENELLRLACKVSAQKSF